MLPSPNLQLLRDKSPWISAPAPFCIQTVDTSVMHYGDTLPQSPHDLPPVIWDRIPNNYLHSVFD